MAKLKPEKVVARRSPAGAEQRSRLVVAVTGRLGVGGDVAGPVRVSNRGFSRIPEHRRHT
jgi:hypothetical protein